MPVFFERMIAAAAPARLAPSAVHPQPGARVETARRSPSDRRRQRAGTIENVCRQLIARDADDPLEIRVGQGVDGRKRADAGGEEDFGLEDVADAGENPLIEQHFRDGISTAACASA